MYRLSYRYIVTYVKYGMTFNNSNLTKLSESMNTTYFVKNGQELIHFLLCTACKYREREKNLLVVKMVKNC